LNYRRPSNDELTPEDLFRPEPANGTTIPGEVVQSTRNDLPWNTPSKVQPPQQQSQQPQGQQQAQLQSQQPQGQPAGYPEYFGAAPTAALSAPAEPAMDEASTQFMPPFPAEQPAAYPGGGQQGYQRPPQQGFQGQGQQGSGFPGSGFQGSGYQEQSYQDQGYQDQGYQQEPQSRGGRFSPRAIGIAVVAGCAVLGIGVAVALSGGGSGAAAKSSVSASAPAGQPGAAGAGSADKGQAQALSDLLSTAANSRSAVISAVAGIEHCQNLDQAQQDLSSAAGLRQQLVEQLGTLQTDKLQNGTELVAALKQGWTASESADNHYAAWATQSKPTCDHKHKPKDGGEKKLGDSASSTATVAKQRASRLWDAIAATTGLPKRGSTQL
jgi:hypothetical protein